ncbi:Isoflavone reductase-like protein [Thalictrum thalictroides]|uniref:Isoflavone reductase-like protein n=1 Tax=Thalictrum thalictroides TaxID=46969 RepID=A0A7J6XI15_THATH|nr:Isoflavone reductase-like protein [Thalictrum thalictroides]
MKVLVVGGTGCIIGRRIVKASLAQGHTVQLTYVLFWPETAYDVDKLQMVLGFKEQGAILIEGLFLILLVF